MAIPSRRINDTSLLDALSVIELDIECALEKSKNNSNDGDGYDANASHGYWGKVDEW